MTNTVIRFFLCFLLVLIAASKRKLDEKDKPAFKPERKITRTGPIQAGAADFLASSALISSDIVPILLETSDFSLAIPFSVVSHEYFIVVCCACFRKLLSLPIAPSKPTPKSVLAFASQYVKVFAAKISPEKMIDAILRLIAGTDNEQIITQAITILSQLDFPESKKKEVTCTVNLIQSRLKPGEKPPAYITSYLRIKTEGYIVFSLGVDVEIWHHIRCSRDGKFCRPDHVNRSKNTFFGNIRVFHPDFFKRKLEEIYIMDNFPIIKECTVKFMPFYKEIMGGSVIASPVFELNSVFDMIKADDCDLFWKMFLTQLASFAKWEQVTPHSYVWQDPILTRHFEKIIGVLNSFFTLADFSVKDLSDSKMKYVGTCIYGYMNLTEGAAEEKVKLVATKVVNSQDFATSRVLVSMLKTAQHYSAIFEAIDAALAASDPWSCALNPIKNLDSHVFMDYLSDRRRNNQKPHLLVRMARNLDQIPKGNVMMAERYNEILEYRAGESLHSVKHLADMIVLVAASLLSNENLTKLVEALSKKGGWVQEAYEAMNSIRNKDK